MARPAGVPPGILDSRVRREALRLLYSRPKSRFYVREIHETLGGSLGTLHRELKHLEASGLATSERVGNLKFYSANLEHPLRRELVSLLKRPGKLAAPSDLRLVVSEKAPFGALPVFPHLTRNESMALERAVHAAKAVFGPALKGITVFGSKVRGDFGPGSDVDVLIVIREKDWKRIDRFFDVLMDIELDHAARLSAKIMTEHEFRKNKSLRSPFIEAVEKEGVAV